MTCAYPGFVLPSTTMDQRYMSRELTHFVGAKLDDEEAQFELLCKILKDGELRASYNVPGAPGTDTPFMLSFFRFAACPFCNLRVHELVERFNEFGDDFTIVAVFDSPLDDLVRHTAKHRAPFQFSPTRTIDTTGNTPSNTRRAVC